MVGPTNGSTLLLECNGDSCLYHIMIYIKNTYLHFAVFIVIQNIQGKSGQARNTMLREVVTLKLTSKVYLLELTPLRSLTRHCVYF